MPRFVLAVFSLALAIGCGSEADSPASGAAHAASDEVAATPVAAPSTPATQPEPAAVAADKTLLFFLNPNGRPCQMQDQILKQMGSSLTDQANLQYVSVTDPSARQVMNRFGIRALPTLIVVDSAGEELHRFPAGIREADAILAALQ